MRTRRRFPSRRRGRGRSLCGGPTCRPKRQAATRKAREAFGVALVDADLVLPPAAHGLPHAHDCRAGYASPDEEVRHTSEDSIFEADDPLHLSAWRANLRIVVGRARQGDDEAVQLAEVFDAVHVGDGAGRRRLDPAAMARLVARKRLSKKAICRWSSSTRGRSSPSARHEGARLATTRRCSWRRWPLAATKLFAEGAAAFAEGAMSRSSRNSTSAATRLATRARWPSRRRLGRRAAGALEPQPWRQQAFSKAKDECRTRRSRRRGAG